METAVVRIERDRFLAGRFRALPIFERVVGPAQQVGRFRIRRSGGEVSNSAIASSTRPAAISSLADSALAVKAEMKVSRTIKKVRVII